MSSYVIFTAGYYQPDDGRECQLVIKQGNLSQDFAYSVAHGVHWLTLDDLRLYFNSEANTTNSIPIINQDMMSDTPIQESAPLLNLTTNFTTIGMQVLDRILSHMDNQHYEGTNMDLLRRIIHGFHMHEVWSQTSLVYQQIKLSPPEDKHLCPCLTDIEINGIYKRLRLMALEIREPQLIYESGRSPRTAFAYNKIKTGHGPTYRNSASDYAVRKKRSTEENDKQMDKEEKDFLESVLAFSEDNDADGPITDEKSWRQDAEKMMRPMTKMHNDLAIFLFCMLEN